MDLIEELKPINFNKPDDEAWKNYANFIDSMTAFFQKNSQTRHFIPWLDEQLQSVDLNSTVDQLCKDELFNDTIGEYFEEMFPMNVIRMEYSKNHNEAIHLCKEANQHFDRHELEQALSYYSKAICLSEQESSDYLLPILYDKRSIVFYCLKQYYDSIMDIQELMLYNHHNSKNKSYLRMAQAAVNIGNEWENLSMLNKIFDNCTTACSTVLNDNKEINQMKNLLNRLEPIINRLKSKQRYATSQYAITSSSSIDIDLPNKNENISGASKKLNLMYFDNDKKYGYKANETIEEGEFIFVEKPFAVHYFSSTNEFFCANCFRRLCHNLRRKSGGYPNRNFEYDLDSNLPMRYSSFVPCYSCNKFIFCDKKCRDEAYNRFHKRECHLFMFALESHIGLAYLVARLVNCVLDSIIKNVDMFDGSVIDINAINDTLKNVEDIESKERSSISSHAGYGNVLKLMNHGDKFDSKSKICFLLTAFFLNHCFGKMQLFQRNPPNQCGLVKILIYHLQQLSTNVFTIFEQNFVIENLSSSHETPIGVGFYPNMALLNHSCDPDLIPIYVGSKIILKAIRRIPIGNEVSFSYGPTYFTMNYCKRQKWFREQYFFTCRCKACLEKKDNFDYALLCSICNGPAFIEKDAENEKHYLFCRNEHRIDDLEPILENIKQGIDHQKAGTHFLKQGVQRKDDDDIVAALVSFYKADVIFTETLYCLHWMLIQLKSQMIDCYLKMGHNDRAAIYCQQIISIYSRYPNNQELTVKLVREHLRLIKIHWLLIDELNSNDSLSLEEKKIELRRIGDKIENSANYCLKYTKLMAQNDIDFIRQQPSKLIECINIISNKDREGKDDDKSIDKSDQSSKH